MKNLISKTAAKTLLSVIIIIFIIFMGFSLGWPSLLASVFEKMGVYSFATGYASLAYTYSGEYNDLARCVDDSILSGNPSNIIDFAVKFVADENFESYCAQRDEAMNGKLQQGDIQYSGYSYKQFVTGNLACAHYAKGDTEQALSAADGALQDVTGFPKNNALAVLCIRAAEKNDTDFMQRLYERVIAITPLAEEEDYYRAVLALLTGTN